MRPIIPAVFAIALLSPSFATAAADDQRPFVVALNPQPEPPGKGKIKRVYSGKNDSRKNLKVNKTKPQAKPVAPTKY